MKVISYQDLTTGKRNHIFTDMAKKPKVPSEIALQVLAYMLQIPDAEVDSANIVDNDNIRIFYRRKDGILVSQLFPYQKNDDGGFFQKHIHRAGNLISNIIRAETPLKQMEKQVSNRAKRFEMNN